MLFLGRGTEPIAVLRRAPDPVDAPRPRQAPPCSVGLSSISQTKLRRARSGIFRGARSALRSSGCSCSFPRERLSASSASQGGGWPWTAGDSPPTSDFQ